METESLEVEDGEIVDEEPVDVFETYNVLQRPPAHVPPVSETKVLNCTDESDVSESSGSDSDSDAGPAVGKIRRVTNCKIGRKKKNVVKSIAQWEPSSNKYAVWCAQLQEVSLTEDLESCEVTRRLNKDRSVESYDYMLGSALAHKKYRDNNTSDEDQEAASRVTRKRTFGDRRNARLSLRKRRNHEEDPKGSARIIPELKVTTESSIDDVAADITEKLSEKKDVLIKRVVEILGKEKAINLFEKTRQIEEEGGMLIMNGSRRRTAGGVYLHLIKTDDHIPQPKIREIFDRDKREATEKKKEPENTNRMQQSQELMKLFENGSNKDLPALLTRAELSTRQIAEEARLRRGEGMDRIPIDSDRTVSNPPPSPVTDDPDHSEPTNPTRSRHIQEYGDDFLDIGVEVDMEVF